MYGGFQLGSHWSLLAPTFMLLSGLGHVGLGVPFIYTSGLGHKYSHAGIMSHECVTADAHFVHAVSVIHHTIIPCNILYSHACLQAKQAVRRSR